MAQQTAVEWLEQEIKKLNIKVDGAIQVSAIRILEQAKQMEREQHESTCVNVIERIFDKLEKGENTNSQDVFNQYYNETN